MSGLRPFVLALLALPLAACISLFPKSEPAQLYRFEISAPAAPAPGPRATLMKTVTEFQRAAAGDRILTVGANGEASYIAGSRWVSPASILLDEQVQAAFRGSQRMRLVARGEMARADYALRLDVVRFETRYDHGPKAAPQVVVELRAVISRLSDHAVLGEHPFTASVRAADNRVGAIVPAYSTAVSAVLSELVAWTDTTGP